MELALCGASETVNGTEVDNKMGEGGVEGDIKCQVCKMNQF